MTEQESNVIRNYDFPKYYKWFYKWYTKWIGSTIFIGILLVGALMIIFGDRIFDVVKYMFFGLFGLVMWALSAYLTKHWGVKRYLAKHGNGMTIERWNELTKGFTIDDLKNI
jgi:hypothetical protein